MTEQTKACAKCGEAKPLLAYDGRRATCRQCVDAAKARTQEKKDAVTFSPALGERITDAIAAGMTVEAICAESWAPTQRQLEAFKRADSGFASAVDQALAAASYSHVDKARAALDDPNLSIAERAKLSQAHLDVASALHPKRWGRQAVIDVTSAGKPLVDFGAAIEALVAALPVVPALPAPLEVEAAPPGETLQ